MPVKVDRAPRNTAATPFWPRWDGVGLREIRLRSYKRSTLAGFVLSEKGWLDIVPVCVFMCMCMCMCICTRMCICMCINVHLCTCVPMSVSMSVSVRLCVSMSVHVPVSVCVYLRVPALTKAPLSLVSRPEKLTKTKSRPSLNSVQESFWDALEGR